MDIVPSELFTDLGLSRELNDLIGAVKRGLPVSTFKALADSLGVSDARLAEVTGISVTTLTRRKREGHLSQNESEHVLRIAGLLSKAVTVFDSLEDAGAWFSAPNLSLGDATPLDYADTEVGGREVENLLGRIEYGVYS